VVKLAAQKFSVSERAFPGGPDTKRWPMPGDLADEMLEFLNGSPLTPDLTWTRDKDFLRHFEAPRMALMRQAIADGGFTPSQAFDILDFGYLHGLTQEFIHRAFPAARLTVCELPTAPVFHDPTYQRIAKSREYLKLIAADINDLNEEMGRYDVIILGEIIEHLDPTVVSRLLGKLRKLVKPGGLLVITTPNGGGLVNCFALMRDHDLVALHPPIRQADHDSMGYNHIHLWPVSQLRPTAEHYGWKLKNVAYYHGREGEYFDRSRRKWSSLKHQVIVKALESIVNRRPKLRGFYVASFGA
jgi:SAM-dependent methyltransferase